MADLRVETAGAVATITLDRPDALNALTVPLKEDLRAAFERLAADDAVRAIVLTGAGRAFCAGQDLRERLEPDALPLQDEIRVRYNPLILAMRTNPKPIVGAINGVAAGAGASLAFACDIRIAAEGASFLLAFGRVGLIPDSGATWLLPRLIGASKATQTQATRKTPCTTRNITFVSSDPITLVSPKVEGQRIPIENSGKSEVKPAQKAMERAGGNKRELFWFANCSLNASQNPTSEFALKVFTSGSNK